MDCSRESWGCCEYQVILWEELFEHSSSLEAWLNDDFLQNRSMWQDPDILQLHHFRAEDWLLWWPSNIVPQHVWWATITTRDWCQPLENDSNGDMSGDILIIVENLDPAAEILMRHSHAWHSEWQSTSCLCSLLTSVDNHGIPHQLRFFARTIYPTLDLGSHLFLNPTTSVEHPSSVSATLLERISETQKKRYTHLVWCFTLPRRLRHQSNFFDILCYTIRQYLYFNSFWWMSTPYSSQWKGWWSRQFYSEYIPRGLSSPKNPTYLLTQ